MTRFGQVVGGIGLLLFLVGIAGLAITDGPAPSAGVSPGPVDWVGTTIDWFLAQLSAAASQIVASGVNAWRRLLQGGIFLLLLGVVVLILGALGGGKPAVDPVPQADGK